MKLKHSVVLITGASSGLGAATALRCALRKAKLVLAARSAQPLEDLALKVRAAGGEALVVPTDVTDGPQVRRMVALVNERFGPVDVLVNSAGYGIFAPIQQAKVDDLAGMVQVNLIGAARCIEAVLPQMLARRRGQIINVASAAGQAPLANLAFYGATKFALVGMSKNMRIDLAGSGVRVATICPGVVETPFFDQADATLLSWWARLPGTLSDVQVAEAIERAILRGLNGEQIFPRGAWLLARISHFAPRLAERLSALIR